MRASRATGRFALCDRPVSIFTTTQLRRLTLIITRRWGTLQSNISSLVVLGHARYHRPVGWQRAARAAPLLLLGAAPAGAATVVSPGPPPYGVDATEPPRKPKPHGTLSTCGRTARWPAFVTLHAKERVVPAAAAPTTPPAAPRPLVVGVLAIPPVAARRSQGVLVCEQPRCSHQRAKVQARGMRRHRRGRRWGAPPRLHLAGVR